MSETTVEKAKGYLKIDEYDYNKSGILNSKQYSTENGDTKLVSCDSSKTASDSAVLPDNEKLLSNGKLSVDLHEVDRSPTKSILSNGSLSTIRGNSKKLVCFDPDNEIVKKFTDGEIIVDQKNPFKNDFSVDLVVNRKAVSKARTCSDRYKALEEDFVTTEQVLKESKYVKTYIRNPDQYFTYDPTIIARIRFEELKELKNKKPPRKIRLSSQTQERLKELKNKCGSLSQSYQGKPSNLQTEITSNRIPTYNKVSKSNYPNLSQIKVKTGTDVETSLFNPDEVTKNAKKFDECVKKLHISSDDDLEEIDEPLTKCDSSDELKSPDQDNTDTSRDEKKSFTGTVNSVEFKEYLKEKGLTLAPKEKITSRSAVAKIEKEDKLKQVPSAKLYEMEQKKVKKPSVFQRLLPSNIFSSKRKTTPKAQVPMPQGLYTNPTDDQVKLQPSIKRVVLERQSFHGGSVNSANTTHDLRKQMERSRKSYSGDDRSSSISSALTNAEEMCESNDSMLERLSSETIEPKSINFRNETVSTCKERLQNSQKKSIEVRDGIVKQRVQRASLALSAPKPLPKKSDKQHVPVMKRTLERHSMVQRRPIGITGDDSSSQFNRSASMDRHKITKYSGNSSRQNNSYARLLRNCSTSQRSGNTPKNSKEELLENGPKLTSTPIQESEKPKRILTGTTKALLSPISINCSIDPPVDFNVGAEEWAKLHEIKENTDRELFNRIAHNCPLNYSAQVGYSDNIYERLPTQQRKLLSPNQPLYAKLMPEANFLRESPQRNSIPGVLRNRNVKIVDGNALLVLDKQMASNESAVRVNTQPPRSQSVLNEMLMPQQQQLPHHPVFGSAAGTPVVMRRKDTASLSKEEILQKVKEFCRKSMNKTPTKMGSSNQIHKDAGSPLKPSLDSSPVSYTSVENQNKDAPNIVAPQVPQRIQSLQSKATSQTPSTSPIYAHVIKRNSVQSNISDIYDSPRIHPIPRPWASTLTSDSDSVFLPSRAQPASPSRYVVVDSEKLTPANVMKNRNAIENAIYGQLMPNPYGFIELKSQVENRIDDRSAPLIRNKLQSSPVYINTSRQSPRYSQAQHHHQELRQHQQPSGNVVYLKVKDQVYRPITFTDRYYRSPKAPPGARPFQPYESESGSEAGEVQRILHQRGLEEDWQNDKSGRNQSGEQATDDRRRAARREDPRRHTLGGDMLQYGGGQGQQQQRSMDLETPPVRGYTPINQGPLFDEDPGIMSEVETASTGFRRGGKQRSSLPVVRTPSKTLERPLGLVFLQYRSETKRALLPNEITSIDTVRALFVRSFPRQLTMAYLEGPNVKIYIHDASKDMFYELEDVRSHLREIRDRSVLRLFESNEVAAPQALPGGPGIPQPLPPPTTGHWEQDQSYFSEPEFDSEYQHQHIHKSKGGKPAPYYVGATQTLPRGMYSDRNKSTIDGYTSSPERGTRGGYEEPYYSQYGTRGTTVTPIIDEEQRCSDGPLNDDQYALYGMKVTGRIPRNPNQLYDPTRPEDLHRIRVEHMERQLANLTGLVQKALNQNPPKTTQIGAINANYLGVPGQCRDKSVSFEKSVSFSDDIQGVPKSHSPQHAADSKPPKPAIKSSTLPRTSSQERDRLKPPPPPKPLALASTHPNYRPDIALAPEVYNDLRGLQKKAKDLRMEVRALRRLSQAQAVAVREDIKDSFMRIRATLLASSGTYWGQGDVEKTRLSREEELYKQEVIRLEKDLSDLESSVEGLRGEVINRRTRVNMAAVEDMALVLSRASKTVAELKMRFPGLQQDLRNILANEMEKVVREEKFLKEEPDRLESALRRCKKLTGTLVTLKRLASVQEQRLPPNEPVNEDPPRSAEISSANKPIPSPRMGSISISGGIPPENALDALLDELQTFANPQSQTGDTRPDDSTSDDSSQTLQNTITTQLSQSSMFPTNDPNGPQTNSSGAVSSSTLSTNIIGLRRLHSYPSGSDTDTSPPQPIRPVGKPPVPERNADLLSKVSSKRVPPPPPPRTSSRSPLASPTSPNIPHRLPSVCESDQIGNGAGSCQDGSGNSSGNESGNDHVQRQLALEMRHQELLKKQKMLQEQYARLQQMSKNSISLPSSDMLQLKKTGSESNLPQKLGFSMTVTGSMKNLNSESSVAEKNEKNLANTNAANEDGSTNNNTSAAIAPGSGQTTTNKVYETDIL